MTYRVKEIFYTLQGEGFHAGRPAVFCRFSGCNLWTGREQDRAKAQCRFCDTDFVGTNGENGGVYESVTLLADTIADLFPVTKSTGSVGCAERYVVFTGGEPALQLNTALIAAMHARGIEVGVETNGTLPLPDDIDWVAVSPKAGSQLTVTSAHELKLVWPQEGVNPAVYEQKDFTHLFLQPKDEEEGGKGSHVQTCIEYCLSHPRWKLSLQTHKLIGIP